MLAFWNSRQRAEEGTSWEKEVDTTVYGPRRKRSCCMITCIGIIATLFFLVGLFQTVVAFAFVKESSRNPTLILGPVFMGIGAMMYMASIEMCCSKYRKPKQVGSMVGDEEDPEGIYNPDDDALFEGDGSGVHGSGEPNKNTLVLRADHLMPAMLTMNADEIQRLGPESKQKLLQPGLPPVDVCMPLMPVYYGGNCLSTTRHHLPEQPGASLNDVPGSTDNLAEAVEQSPDGEGTAEVPPDEEEAKPEEDPPPADEEPAAEEETPAEEDPPPEDPPAEAGEEEKPTEDEPSAPPLAEE